MKFILMLTMSLFMIGVGMTEAAAVTAESWCPITGSKGTGSGPTFSVAKDRAIKACLANGGLAKCCYKFYRQTG
jgi:hypothetical protein